MKNKDIKNKLKKNYKKLRSIVFDYFACGFLFLILSMVVLLIAVFDSKGRNAFNLIGLYATVLFLGLIAMFFFYLYIKYGIIYYQLKKDIKLNRVKDTQFTVKKAKPIRQVRGRFSSDLGGIKMCSAECNKRYYMFFAESINYSQSQRCKFLSGLSQKISYYEKSGCIIDCNEKESIVRTIKKPIKK